MIKEISSKSGYLFSISLNDGPRPPDPDGPWHETQKVVQTFRPWIKDWSDPSGTSGAETTHPAVRIKDKIKTRVKKCDRIRLQTILIYMGFDPNRFHRRRPSDFAFVISGIAVALLLLIWAFLG